jgi:hypothetical protein
LYGEGVVLSLECGVFIKMSTKSTPRFKYTHAESGITPNSANEIKFGVWS